MESRLVWPAFFDEKNEKEQSYDERKKRKGCWLGRWHFFLVVPMLLNTGITALASEQSEEHAQICGSKTGGGCFGNIPELEEVKEQLTEEELVYAEDPTIKSRRAL